MKKPLPERYFSIAGKNLADITKEESTNIARSFIASSDIEMTSLITLLSFFDDKEDVAYAIQNNTLSNTGNLKPLIRDILREYRKTLSLPVNTLSVLIEVYYEAFQYVADIIEEIYDRLFYDYLFEDGIIKRSLEKVINLLANFADDTRFPLQRLSLSEAKKVFYKEKEHLDVLKKIKGTTSDIREIKFIEMLVFITLKKQQGLTFNEVLSLDDSSITPELEFFYSILYVYSKEPYDLLEANSQGLREMAIGVTSS